MDKELKDSIVSLMSALANEADRSNHDPIHVHKLLTSTVSKMSLLLTHIGYLECKLDSATQRTKALSAQNDNMTAEIQRLNSIAKY